MKQVKKQLSGRALAASLSLTLIAAVVPTVAKADALAQGILNIRNFTLTASGDITGTASGLGTVSGQLNGVNLANVNAPGVNYNQSTSLGAGYVSNSPILGAPTSTFAGGTTSVGGGAVTNAPFNGAGANALADSVVSLVPQGTGNVQTNTGTTFSYNVTLASASSISIAFNADLFLRALLDGAPLISGTATANSNWSITITSQSLGEVFNWAPNGKVDTGSIVGGIETLDDFSLSRGATATANFINETVVNNSNGSFAAQSNTFVAGNYTLTINHKVDSRATVEVPEPGTLALVGLSLVGVAAVGRRRAIRQTA